MSGTADIAMSRLGFGLAQPSAGEAADAARLQDGIDATMRAVIADRHNPTRRDPSPTVTVAGAIRVKDGNELSVLPRGNGWAEPRPLESPMPKGSFVEQVIGGMIDRALGPAVAAKADLANRHKANNEEGGD